jgi:hypothetical protein
MSDTSDITTDDDSVAVIESAVTANEFLELGLGVWYTASKLRTFRTQKSKVGRFIDYYGVRPSLCASIWEDLQCTKVAEAKLDENHLNPKHFLMALHTLKRYPTDNEREGPWDINRDVGRTLVWYFLRKIQALKAEVIVWPEDWGPDVWIITVDGTHCWIEEPIHPDWSQDRTYFSHKYNKAGINYELGIAIAYPRLVWMNGPFRAGKSDVKVFRDKGLKEKLLSVNKKAIGDRGYNGHTDACSTFNAHDCRGVRKFKSRALKRHENFNNMIKRFTCVSGRFRHGVDQFQIEDDMPLYDVLIEDILEED